MNAAASGYQKLRSLPDPNADYAIWLSPSAHDSHWDEFLVAHPLGQFQQSSLWAEYKAVDGWRHHRIILTREQGIVGGFQVLWKSKMGIRIGYVSKGPVADPKDSFTCRQVTEMLNEVARDLNLAAMVAQVPDEAADLSSLMLGAGFLVSNPTHVIEATYVVSLDLETAALLRRMSPSFQRNLIKAKKHACTIRVGTEDDLAAFFSLMSASCRRQGVTPNPNTEDALRRLWKLFSQQGWIRLTLANCNGTSVAGKLSLCFGRQITAWKKGWNGTSSYCHPNELLVWEELTWARKQELGYCDYCAFDRLSAELLLSGIDSATMKLSSQDDYRIRFGGTPKLLPRAMLLISNSYLRWLYRHTYSRFEMLLQFCLRKNRLKQAD